MTTAGSAQHTISQPTTGAPALSQVVCCCLGHLRSVIKPTGELPCVNGGSLTEGQSVLPSVLDWLLLQSFTTCFSFTTTTVRFPQLAVPLLLRSWHHLSDVTHCQ